MKSLGPIMLIIISIGIFFFYVDPEYKKVKELQDEIKANKEVLVVANNLKLKKDELNAKFNQISQLEKENLEKLLPDTVDNVRLIIDINSIANSSSVVIRDINIQSNESNISGDAKKTVSQSSNFNAIKEEEGIIKYVDTSKIGVLTFSFSVSAKYEVFLDFLKQLEESLRLIDIRNIEVSRGSENNAFYDYKVTFDTYWLK